MDARVLGAMLACAVALAGCAADEGSPDPTPSPTPTSTSGSTSGSGMATNTSSSTASSSSSTTPAPRPAQTLDIDIQGNQFVDGSPTIQKGDTVRWTQRDTATHTVTADDGSFDSGNLVVGVPTRSQFSHTFDAVGEVPYHCEVHPGMTGTVTVVAALPP